MAAVCQVTGAVPGFGHNISHSHRRTKRRFDPIVQKKTYYVPSLGRKVTLNVSAKGIKVIGSPIGPYKGAAYWTEEGEAARREINEWILTGGAFDGIVRLDTAFADPADPAKMRDGYHMGDFLHGTDAGLKAVGESIDLALFAAD